MRKTWFARVLLVNLLLGMLIYGVRPIVSYRALALDAGPAALGLLAACYAALSIVIAVPAGRWVDRFGEAGCMVAGTAIVLVSALMLAVSQNLAIMGLAMITLGAGQITAAVGVQTLIASGGSAQGLDARFATQTVNASLGQFIGPAMAGYIVAEAMRREGTAAGGIVSVAATDGVFWAGAAAGLIAFAAALSLWRWPPDKYEDHRRSLSTTESEKKLLGTLTAVLRIPSIPQAMLVSMAALSTIDIIVAYLPAYGVAYGIPVETIGLLLAARGGASLASRLLMVPLRRAFGRRRMLIGGLIIPAATLVIFPLFAPIVPVLFVAMVLIGLGLGICQPLTMSWVAARAPAEIRGSAVGLRLSANRLGQFLLPAAVGIVAGAAGISAIFWVLGLLLGASSALITRRTFE